VSSLVTLLLAAAPLLRDDSLALRPEWTPMTLPAQRLPLTRYSAQALDGRRALRLDAAGSTATSCNACRKAVPARADNTASRSTACIADLRLD
jgi:hypothetical protein